MSWIGKQLIKAGSFLDKNQDESLIDTDLITTEEEEVIYNGDFRDNPKYYAGSGAQASSGSWGVGYAMSFDGEKNQGELGKPIHYMMDFRTLSIRSWQSYAESELTKTIIDKYVLWIIDGGLKLQADPAERVLKMNKLALDVSEFNENIEAMFSIWAGSKSSSFDGMGNLNLLASEAYKQAKIGGDVLVVLRLVAGVVKIQLIDGAHIGSPIGNTHEGNRVKNGVEINSNGEHVAYHVKVAGGKWDRIPAKSTSSGLTVAFLVYGSKYRLGDVRGLPIISAALETVKKLERYKEAAVGSAEERAKIPYQIVHGVHSSGENPLFSQIAEAANVSTSGESGVDMPKDDAGVALAANVAATTNKQVFNMPNDAEMKSLESKNEMFFKEFYSTNADVYCASVGIPPNVAFSLYNNSFSASRTATKDWEHTMMVERSSFGFQFYQPIYDFFFHIQILLGAIQAPGYLGAYSKDQPIILDAYRKARFTGTMFPHIDPLKEVNAERAKLGEAGKFIPLTTAEAATEALNGGDSSHNIKQFAKELEESKDLGIESTEAQDPGSGSDNTNDDDDDGGED